MIMQPKFDPQIIFKTFHQVFWISLVITILILFSSLYSIQVLDRVLSSSNYYTLFWLTLAAILIYIELHFLQCRRVKILNRLANIIDLNFTEKDIRDIFLLRYSTGFASNISNIRAFITHPSGIVGFYDSILGIFFLIAIFSVHWINGMIALFGTITIAVISYNLERIFIKEKYANVQKILNSYNTWINSTYKEGVFVRSTCLKNIVKYVFRTKKSNLKTKIEYDDLQAIHQNVTQGMKAILQTLLFASSASLVVANYMTSGGIIVTSILFGKIVQPFTNIGLMIKLSQSFLKSYGIVGDEYRQSQKMSDLTNSNNNKTSDVTIIRKLEGITIRIDGLFIKQIPNIYQGDILYSLKGISLAIPSGTAISLIGGNNSGKTVLLQTIAGAIRPTLGKVMIDGIDIGVCIDAEENLVSYLSIDAELINGTVLQNITRFEENVDMEMLNEICKLSGTDSFISSLSNGYQTLLENAPISHGQKRMILIARSFYKWPKIILLNNPTISLDDRGAILLFKLIHMAKSKGSIVICETQNVNLMRNTDKYIMLRNGELQEYDSPEKLFQKPQNV